MKKTYIISYSVDNDNDNWRKSDLQANKLREIIIAWKYTKDVQLLEQIQKKG